MHKYTNAIAQNFGTKASAATLEIESLTNEVLEILGIQAFS
ncbi:hypothetical protein [Fischerella sp.]|nr:hypothetical protein [Fischerella sp.]